MMPWIQVSIPRTSRPSLIPLQSAFVLFMCLELVWTHPKYQSALKARLALHPHTHTAHGAHDHRISYEGRLKFPRPWLSSRVGYRTQMIARKMSKKGQKSPTRLDKWEVENNRKSILSRKAEMRHLRFLSPPWERSEKAFQGSRTPGKQTTPQRCSTNRFFFWF